MVDEKRKSFVITAIYFTIIGVISYYFGRLVFTSLLPLVLAFIIAYFGNRLAIKFEGKFKIKKSILALIFSLTILVISILAIIALIYFSMILSGKYIDKLGEIIPKITDQIGEIKNQFKEIILKLLPGIKIDLDSISVSLIEDILIKITDKLTFYIGSFVKNTPKYILNLVITLISTCYIAKDYDLLYKFVKNLIGKRQMNSLSKIKNILYENVFKIIRGYLILSIPTFFTIFIGLFILGVNDMFSWALIITIVDLLPVFGAGTVLIPWSIINLLIFNRNLGFGLAVVYGIHLIIRNYLEPKIIAEQIGINPLFTLVAMFLGLKIFGFWGLILMPISLVVLVNYYKS